ncbi:MAG: trypsin-like peptidase domain-containing protein [Elusimicrobiota bacterium]|nr:MAG: trypsin-like peptidase domain-containing protein [Elusimicrobiota bacterium]
MIARVKGSVVNVIVRTPNGMGTGSGFILSPDGVFITNAHVVGSRQPGQFVEARIPGTPGVMKAKVLAVNHDKDLAIVQLQRRPDGKPWPVVKLASEAPREGSDVTAAGYPRGLPFTVTAGVISGMDGRGNMYVKHLQTDASINPGNSGGPLFNAKGEVVGVNTQIYTQSGGSDGLGFSIMAPEVGRVLAQYQKTGNISTASLGIIANLSDPMKPEAGLEVEYVRRGSAAEKAGIQRGDLIISVGGEPIGEAGSEAAGHVAAALSKMIPGQQVPVVVLRGDSPVEISVTADAKVTVSGR